MEATEGRSQSLSVTSGRCDQGHTGNFRPIAATWRRSVTAQSHKPFFVSRRPPLRDQLRTSVRCGCYCLCFVCCFVYASFAPFFFLGFVVSVFCFVLFCLFVVALLEGEGGSGGGEDACVRMCARGHVYVYVRVRAARVCALECPRECQCKIHG